jgi:phosphate:Na+ symporter
MLSMGWIPFNMACAMVLGENIGTTITANIAASVGNTQAKRAAMSHTIFNLTGVIWALALYNPFLRLVGSITEALFGLPNPAAEGFIVTGPTSAEGTAALYGLSMLHTLFNVINTLLLVWFTKWIAKAVSWLIRTPENQEKEVFKLKYISAGHLATPELSVEQAFEEIIHFALISKKGATYIKEAISETESDKFEELREKLVKYEEISDRIEYEIATFLNGVSAEEISESTSNKIKAMYKIIGELESLGDSGETISRILSRKNIHKKKFDAESIKNLNLMAEAIEEAYSVMIANLNAAHKDEAVDITKAYNAEEHINTLRNNFRDTLIEDMDNGDKNYQTMVYYMDIMNAYERMGDFMINVSQDLERGFAHK